MRKFLSIFLALMMALTLISLLGSCGSDAPTTDSQPQGTKPLPCSHQYESVVTKPTETEQGFTTHTCSLCGDCFVDSYVEKLGPLSLQYDDYLTSIGEISATAQGLTINGSGLEIVTVQDVTYFHANAIGTATVSDGTNTRTVNVGKAKINIIVVMGQSNSCDNLFPNLTSDIACPLGTAYWFGNGKGTSATAPVPYTEPSGSFHSTLLAELYAQSVAAGDPVKNVLVWDNGVTSKSGMSITWWASGADDNSGTAGAASMLKACKGYYSKNDNLYDVVNRGVYWLQGEIDGSTETPNHDPMSPEKYTECFLSMWRAMNKAGAEYLAFLRVRGDVEDNKLPNASHPDHNDLAYTTALSAQLALINEHPEFYLATTLTEHWVGTEDTVHTVDISQYITLMEAYSNGTRFSDSYKNVATYADGKLTMTMKELYGSNNYCHYGKFGYTLMGADAAYNMYRALHGTDFAIVLADASGSPEKQSTAKAGETVTLKLSTLSEDLSFRPSCDSTSGTMTVIVRSGESDITEAVTISSGAHFGTIDIEKLSAYQNVTITVTYTPTEGAAGTVTYKLQ